jgi:hypothetical protein
MDRGTSLYSTQGHLIHHTLEDYKKKIGQNKKNLLQNHQVDIWAIIRPFWNVFAPTTL